LRGRKGSGGIRGGAGRHEERWEVVVTRPSSGRAEVRDDRWGPPVSRREERVKAARLVTLPREEGGNRIRRHRHADQLGRSRGRGPVGRGGAAGWKKKEWAAAGLKGRMGRKLRRIISK
jgi:hypothetical protein